MRSGIGAAVLSTILATNAFAQNPTLQLDIPKEMVTGNVKLRATTNDLRVKIIKWIIGDRSTRAKEPDFETNVYLDGVPRPKEIRVIAYDDQDHPLYEQNAMLNAGASSTYVQIINPVTGQQLSDDTLVQAKADVAPDRTIKNMTLRYHDENGDQTVPFTKEGDIYQAHVKIGKKRAYLSAMLETDKGSIEDAVIVNDVADKPQFYSDVHSVEQIIKVDGKEEINARDITVKDDGGIAQVESVHPLFDAPLNIGINMHIGDVAAYKFGIEKESAADFINTIMRGNDNAFLLAYAQITRVVQPWTSSKEAMVERIKSLRTMHGECESHFYDSIVQSLYQFQGGTGPKILIVLTDGYEYGSQRTYRSENIGNPCNIDVTEAGTPTTPLPRGSDATLESMTQYLRESGVTPYFIGIDDHADFQLTYKNGDKKKTDEARWVVYKDLLQKIARETGGKVYLVKGVDDMQAAYKDIQNELRGQYVVEFQSKAKRNNTFHPNEIKFKGKKIDSAPGFYY